MLQDRANMSHSLSFYSDQMDRRLCDRFLVGILSCSMARVGFTLLRSLRNAINPSLFKPQTFRPYTSNANASRYVDRNHVRLPFSYSFLRAKELSTFRIGSNASYRTLVSGHVLDGGSHKVKRAALVSASFKRLHVRGAFPSALAVPLFGLSSRPSLFSTKADKPGNTEAPGATGETNVISSDGLASDWVDKVKHAWQSTLDTVTNAGHKAKEASDELTPHVQQLLDTYPYLNDVVVPVSLTLTGTVLAWVVMPRILRKFHKYATQGTVTLLPGSLSVDQFPYERSFWGALEDPVRYLITFMAFSQIGMLVAPTTIASQYISPAWRGAVILSFVWFLQRMKTNLLARALAAQSLAGLDREKLLTLDKVSSVGLFVIGLMAMSEACGVAVQSILTVGGIGGVATAFAARDVLGNVLSGLSMQFSKPFSLGDTIKAGSIEGQVVEMGLTTTSLLNAEKFPVLVPNSMFSSQVIVNKSRAEFRAIVSKIPLQTDDLDKVPQISDEIKEMLRSNAKVFLGKESPYCYLSQVEKSFAELTLGCNLKHMKKDEMYSTQQEILLRSVEIIKKHGASLGDTWDKGSV